MIDNYAKINNLNHFVFEYDNVKYNISTQKLQEVLKILHFDLKENDILSEQNFKNFLKRHGLLNKEFIEYISIS